MDSAVQIKSEPNRIKTTHSVLYNGYVVGVAHHFVHPWYTWQGEVQIDLDRSKIRDQNSQVAVLKSLVNYIFVENQDVERIEYFASPENKIEVEALNLAGFVVDSSRQRRVRREEKFVELQAYVIKK